MSTRWPSTTLDCTTIPSSGATNSSFAHCCVRSSRLGPAVPDRRLASCRSTSMSALGTRQVSSVRRARAEDTRSASTLRWASLMVRSGMAFSAAGRASRWSVSSVDPLLRQGVDQLALLLAQVLTPDHGQHLPAADRPAEGHRLVRGQHLAQFDHLVGKQTVSGVRATSCSPSDKSPAEAVAYGKIRPRADRGPGRARDGRGPRPRGRPKPDDPTGPRRGWR